MRKICTISVVLLLTLAGMNFSIASHYCHGDLAATVISINGKTHPCCMDHQKTSSTHTTVSAECCKDDIRVYHVEENYTPSDVASSSVPPVTGCSLPEALHVSPMIFSSLNKTNDSPPGSYLVSEVSPAEICVFRI